MDIKIPRILKKVSEENGERINKVKKMLEATLECDYIKSYPIEDFDIKFLDLLAEYAKENNIVITIKAEHSNIYQGVLLLLVKREHIQEFKQWI